MRCHYKVPPSEPKPYYNYKKQNIPIRCDSCYLHNNLCDSCQQVPCGIPPARRDPRWSYCPAETDSGLLHTIRNGFQRIFNGNRKRGCATTCDPVAKSRVYTYTRSQLKNIDQCLDKLEEETSCVDSTIKEAFSCNYCINYGELRCFLTNILEQLEALKSDLCCASDCYDPSRDRHEHDMIASMLERACGLECCANDLCLQLECLMCKSNSCKPCEVSCRKPCCNKISNKPKAFYKTNPCDSCNTPKCTKPCCYKVTCAGDCRKPCCYKKPVYEVNGQKRCCAKLPTCDTQKLFAKKWRSTGNSHLGKSDLCRTSSVIPVGVMLVKL